MRTDPHRCRIVVTFTAVILLLALASGVAAQRDNSGRLDLRTAVSLALENDPQLKAAQTETKIAELKISEAKTGRQPTIQFNQSFTRSNNPVFVFGTLLEQGRFTSMNFALDSLNHPNGSSNLRSSVTVSAPLFDQWQTRTRISRAEIEKRRSQLRTDMTGQRLRFDVLRTFYGTILANELLKATDGALRSAKENSRKTRDFVYVGMVPESDSLVADVELANVEQQLLEAQGAAATTRAALNITIGKMPGSQDELVGTLREKYFPIEEQSELIRIALENRPDYQQAQLAVDDSREQTKSAQNSKLPRLDAFGNYGYSSPYITNGSSDYTVGLSLTYTIFDPGRKARIEQSTLAETVAGSERDRLRDQITLEVIKALQNFTTARSKIQVSIKSTAQAEEALRILQDRYRAAISTFDAVLRAEAALLRAKHDLLRAKYEFYVSYAAILLATGRLTDVSAFEN